MSTHAGKHEIQKGTSLAYNYCVERRPLSYPFLVIHAGRFDTFLTLLSLASAELDALPYPTGAEDAAVAVAAAPDPFAAVPPTAVPAFSDGMGVPSGGDHAP